MKIVLALCLFSAVFVKRTTGQDTQCVLTCATDNMQGDITSGKNEADVCRAVKLYLNCVGTTCKIDVAPAKTEMEQRLKTLGYTCDLSGSRILSASLFSILGSLLISGYSVRGM